MQDFVHQASVSRHFQDRGFRLRSWGSGASGLRIAEEGL